MTLKTEAIASLIANNFNGIKTLLVVGCGSGEEAVILQQHLHAKVVGIDLHSPFKAEATRTVDLRRGDATALDFPEHSFDFVYSYHALEHIPDYRRALLEMRRVLKAQGAYCIGTPNRQRLIGYLGSKKATLRQKVIWNSRDWRAKLKGQFHNKFGAHAGFTSTELQMALAQAIGNPTNITKDYYLAIYNRHPNIIRCLLALHLDKYLFPSIYFIGTKDSRR